MLNHYKDQYLNKNQQFILVNDQGTIIETDQTILAAKKGQSIFDINPFFESFPPIINDFKDAHDFNCIHLEINGQRYIVDVKIIKVKDGNLIVINDLTQHYTEYQIVAQARNESVINAELIVLKNVELEEREKFKNTFIQNFSHELRNPLTSIISITNFLGNTALTLEQKRMIDFLKESNDHLKLMLEDILSLSMMASDKLVINETSFNLHQLLELLKFTYTAKAKNKSLGFELNYTNLIPEFVLGDRLRMFQVLANLLDNAIKYTEKGFVSLDVQLNHKRAGKVNLHFQVTDTGSGIPEENQTVIFESFSRLEKLEKRDGTGLGLAIVKGLLERMNSKIKVQSNVGKGSVFYFDILFKYPLAIRTKRETAEKSTNVFFKSKKDRKFKILLVEDDIRVQTVFFKTLISTGHFHVDLINDGALVIDEILNTTFDLIIMDVDLPNIPGHHITKLIRELPMGIIKNIPIIGVTANAFEENIKDYLNSGMNAVLTKPFDEKILLKTLFKFLK